MNLMERMVEQARANKQRIVLPEGTEERTLQAADRILADNIADIILIGEPSEIMELADRYKLKHIDKATLVNPASHEKKETYTQLLYELRKAKGVTLEKAEKMVEDPLFLGCLMIKTEMPTVKLPELVTRQVMCYGRLFKLSKPLPA